MNCELCEEVFYLRFCLKFFPPHPARTDIFAKSYSVSDLQFISFAVFLFAILFGFVVNMIYFKLCKDVLKTEYKRVSLPLLNEAIRDKKSEPHLSQLLYCRKMYIAYLVVLSLAILFVVFVVLRGTR